MKSATLTRCTRSDEDLRAVVDSLEDGSLLHRRIAIKPTAATRCTLQMLEGAADDWDHLGWGDQVRDILAATDHATDPEAIRHRKAIVDLYVKHGEYDFRVFAPSKP